MKINARIDSKTGRPYPIVLKELPLDQKTAFTEWLLPIVGQQSLKEEDQVHVEYHVYSIWYDDYFNPG